MQSELPVVRWKNFEHLIGNNALLSITINTYR